MRKAFTVVEIIIVIFLLVMAASFVIPMSMANISQAERVAKWKNTYEEIMYSLKLLSVKSPEVMNLAKCDTIQDTKEAFEIFKPYLDIDEEKSKPEYFKNYRYKFLNGKKVSKNSDFYVKDFIMLSSGVIIGFKASNCSNLKSNHKAVMLFDVNGFDKPNRIGKDIFGIYLYEDALKPFGEDSSFAALKTNCSPIGTGVFCSKYYLVGSAL